MMDFVLKMMSLMEISRVDRWRAGGSGGCAGAGGRTVNQWGQRHGRARWGGGADATAAWAKPPRRQERLVVTTLHCGALRCAAAISYDGIQRKVLPTRRDGSLRDCFFCFQCCQQVVRCCVGLHVLSLVLYAIVGSSWKWSYG